MKRIVALAAALAFCSTAAFADDKPTDDEAAKIKEAVAAWGCEGGEYEKESEGTGVYEAEDVKCKSGQYDFRLDKDFSVFVITKD
jgi:opacity protein-like surface antigen